MLLRGWFILIRFDVVIVISILASLFWNTVYLIIIIIIIIIQHFYSAYRVRGYRGAGGARLSQCEQMSLEMSLECLNSTA